jgi:hypothetical protein
MIVPEFGQLIAECFEHCMFQICTSARAEYICAQNIALWTTILKIFQNPLE